MKFYSFRAKNSYYYHVGLLNNDLNVLNVIRGKSCDGIDLSFKVLSGRSGGDVISTGLVTPIVVSDNFVSSLVKFGLTGWEIKKILLYGKKREKIENYYLLVITGKVKSIQKSGIIQEQLSQHNPKAICAYEIGYSMNDSDWDKSDLFMAENAGFYLLNEKAYESLRSANLKGIDFEDMSEFKLLVKARILQ